MTRQGFIDKIGGLKEQVVGKVKREPGLVQHGKDRMTGIVKHKQMEEDVRELLWEFVGDSHPTFVHSRIKIPLRAREKRLRNPNQYLMNRNSKSHRHRCKSINGERKKWKKQLLSIPRAQMKLKRKGKG
jgi:hypothetical protein